MINQVIQLVAPRQLAISFQDISLDTDDVIVRPTYLSICAADQRYYTGNRDKKTLKKKLPMALIHEAAGVVVYDRKGQFQPGDHVLMIPNTPMEKNPDIAENYLYSSKFRASGFDGFTQEYVAMHRDRVVRYSQIPSEIAAICELVSVAMHSVDTFLKFSHGTREVIGVFGDGNLGYITSLLLKKKSPESKVAVFGLDEQKLNYFSFADFTFHVDEVPEGFTLDHAFECVGGQGSEGAIQQIIDLINPEGTIMLMGVSENNVPIQTRMVLEKGLKLIGRSRSGRQDFKETARLLEETPEICRRLKKIIREVIVVRKVTDIYEAFEEDLTSAFKTVMKWEI